MLAKAPCSMIAEELLYLKCFCYTPKNGFSFQCFLRSKKYQAMVIPQTVQGWCWRCLIQTPEVSQLEFPWRKYWTPNHPWRRFDGSTCLCLPLQMRIWNLASTICDTSSSSSSSSGWQLMFITLYSSRIALRSCSSILPVSNRKCFQLVLAFPWIPIFHIQSASL